MDSASVEASEYLRKAKELLDIIDEFIAERRDKGIDFVSEDQMKNLDFLANRATTYSAYATALNSFK